MTQVSVIGLWHLGTVTAGGLAKMGNQVVGIDEDSQIIEQLSVGKPPLFEPGLAELLKSQQKRLIFQTDYSSIKKSDFVFIAYDTPVDEKDQADLTPINNAILKIIPLLKMGATVIITSQVPVGTLRGLNELISKARPNLKYTLAYFPENLRLGMAIDRFLHPDMIVLGVAEGAKTEKLESFFKSFESNLILTNFETAEMAKHSINLFLALSVVFGNELARICQTVGADAVKVSEIMSADHRIGSGLPLRPGMGFSGGTLARDVKVIRDLIIRQELKSLALERIYPSNELQFEFVPNQINKIFGKKKLKLGILGLTYKAGTSTLRRSASVRIVNALEKLGHDCICFDPKADANKLNRTEKVDEVFNGTQAVVLLTDWPEFKDLPFKRLGNKMKSKVLIDAKNFYDPEAIHKAGFAYYGVGREAI